MRYRQKISEYMTRAEELKQYVQKEKEGKIIFKCMQSILHLGQSMNSPVV